jgi:multiple sugar transport system ATP-binding protein
VENLGSDRLIYGILEQPFAGASVVARLGSRIPIHNGEVRPFGVRENDVRVFDKATGLRTDSRPLPG